GGSGGGVSSGPSGSFSSATPAHPPRSLVARFDRLAAEGRQMRAFGRGTLNGREKVPRPLSSPNSGPPRGAVQRPEAPAFSCRRGSGSPYSGPAAAGFSAT